MAECDMHHPVNCIFNINLHRLNTIPRVFFSMTQHTSLLLGAMVPQKYRIIAATHLPFFIEIPHT